MRRLCSVHPQCSVFMDIHRSRIAANTGMRELKTRVSDTSGVQLVSKPVRTDVPLRRLGKVLGLIGDAPAA